MEFEWDEAKHVWTVQERGIGFNSAARIFSGRVVSWRDDSRDYGEDRFRAIGETQGAILHVVFTRRGEAIRIISARRANRNEVRKWQSLE